jgi:hypothetical protein
MEIKLLLKLALLAFVTVPLHATTISKQPEIPAVVPETEADIAEFTRNAAAEKILSDFRKVGKDAKRIRILLSTFDALEARMGKEKLSDVYREEVEKLVQKVGEDKKTYGLNNDQIKNMINLNKNFNKFIKDAMSIVRTQEERR